LQLFYCILFHFIANVGALAAGCDETVDWVFGGSASVTTYNLQLQLTTSLQHVVGDSLQSRRSLAVRHQPTLLTLDFVLISYLFSLFCTVSRPMFYRVRNSSSTLSTCRHSRRRRSVDRNVLHLANLSIFMSSRDRELWYMLLVLFLQYRENRRIQVTLR